MHTSDIALIAAERAARLAGEVAALRAELDAQAPDAALGRAVRAQARAHADYLAVLAEPPGEGQLARGCAAWQASEAASREVERLMREG